MKNLSCINLLFIIFILSTCSDDGPRPADDVTITVEENVDTDIVTFEGAVYDEGKNTLTIKAESTAGSTAVLTVSSDDFASKVMRYDSRIGMFKVTVRKVISDSRVGIIKSSFGGKTTFNW